LSRYFGGAEVIVTSNNNDINTHRDQFGHIKFEDPALTYYVKGPNGQYASGTYQQLKSQGLLPDVNRHDKNHTTSLGLSSFTTFEGNLDNVQPTLDDLFTKRDANLYTGFRNFFSDNDIENVTRNSWEPSGRTYFDPDQDISKGLGELAK
jgi:hypothetical protein